MKIFRALRRSLPVKKLEHEAILPPDEDVHTGPHIA
jgi:hypothetical protein